MDSKLATEEFREPRFVPTSGSSFSEMRKLITDQNNITKKQFSRVRHLEPAPKQSARKILSRMKESVETTRYLPKTPLKLMNQDQTLAIPINSTSAVILGDPTTDFGKNGKSLKREASTKIMTDRKIVEETGDYYKYWKTKAGQYQQKNFELERALSHLKQQIQILRHQNQKLTKKVQMKEYDSSDASLENLHKRMYIKASCQQFEEIYKGKIEDLTLKVKEQEVLISRQNKKIKQLSKYISQNEQLKSVLGNLEDKMQEKSFILDESFSKDERRSLGKRKGSGNTILREDRKTVKSYNKGDYGDLLSPKRYK